MIANAGEPRKLRIELPDKVRIGKAVDLCLSQARDIVRHNEGGVVESVDPEFLHQMRVSVRGARALLRPLRGMYGARALDRLKTELTWLARITGHLRDVDVFLELLPHYADALPADAQSDLEPFRLLLDDHRRRARDELRHDLDSPRYRNLIRDWRRFASRAERKGRRAKRSARRVVKAWTWSRYRKTRRCFAALNSDSAATEIHSARIELKKLRYLIECFRSLFSPKDVERVLVPLKAAQDALGIVNDLAVQRSMIRRMARSAGCTHFLPGDTVIAMGELSARLEAERRSLMADLSRHMKPLASRRSRRRFRALYGP